MAANGAAPFSFAAYAEELALAVESDWKPGSIVYEWDAALAIAAFQPEPTRSEIKGMIAASRNRMHEAGVEALARLLAS